MKKFFKFVKTNQTNFSLMVGIVVMLLIIAAVLVWNYQRWLDTSPARISATSTDVPNQTEQTQQTEQTNQTEQIEYTVRVGDNLWKIAEKELGSGYEWNELYSDNRQTIGSNPGVLAVGQKLQINKKHQQTETVDTKYQIQSGDSLWKIADKLCGSGFEYRLIANLNNISNPSLIYPGRELVVKCTKPNSQIMSYRSVEFIHVNHLVVNPA